MNESVHRFFEFGFCHNQPVHAYTGQLASCKIQPGWRIQDYERKNQGHRVHPARLVLSEVPEFDLFKIGVFSFDWIISEKTKNILEEQGIASYETRKVDWLHVPKQ
jgi:hypothetical protein